MKKKDLMIIFLLAAIAAGFLILFAPKRNNRIAERVLQVYVDGKLFTEAPLRAGERVTIHPEDGSENVIGMLEDGFYMESATCRDQLCVAQGQVTVENWKRRKLGNQIICLPNRVVVELKLVSTDPAATVDPFVPDI